VRVYLFSDIQKTRQVATGTGIISNGMATVNVSEASNSGLSGRIDVDVNRMEGLTLTSIELQAVPRFLSWRLQYLRTLWEEEDRPTDAYSEGAPSSGTDGRIALLKVKAPLPS
jgi:hypothetical protein